MHARLVPNVSVDSIVFGFDSIHLNILLIGRSIFYNGSLYHDWKFPGDLIRKDEDLDAASKRILKELTGIEKIYMKQLKAFGTLDRLTKRPRDISWLISIDHPEKRVITIPYYSLISLEKNGKHDLMLNENARWVPVNNAKKMDLAFDHMEILEFALNTLRNEMRTKPIAFELLPTKFSLTQLQKIYEVIFETTLDKRNFRKKIANLSYIVPLNEREKDVSHRPAKLYMFSRDVYLRLKSKNFDFTI